MRSSDLRPATLEPLRVLFVTSQLGLGGLEKNLVELVTAFDPTKVEPRVLVFRPGGEREQVLRQDQIPVAVLRSHYGRGVDRLWGIFRECRSFRPHILHAFDSAAGIYSCLAGRLAGVPFVVSAFFANYLPARVRYALRGLSPLIDLVICNSEAGHRYMRRHRCVPAKRLVVIAQGLDFQRMKSGLTTACSLRAELGLGHDQPLIGMIGKLNEDKTPMVFVRAAAIVHQVYPQAAFCIIGSGPQWSAIQEFLAARTLADCFFLIPERQDAPWLASEFDIGVLCSRAEGLPTVLLEYMYWSKPCVVTDVGDCARVVQNGTTGLVVPPGDPEAFARALLELLADPHRAQQMGAAGRVRLEAHFRIERYVDDFLKLYRTALSEFCRQKAIKQMVG